MKKLTTTLCLTIAVLLGSAGVSFGLPPCSGYWHNCVGSQQYANGFKFIGEWRNGKLNGQGEIIFLGGSHPIIYVGEVKDNLRHGHGSISFEKTGNKYVGEWRNGKKNGQGTFFFGKSGSEYVGEFKNNKMNGRGTLTFGPFATHAKYGEKYVGEFNNNQMNGPGVLYAADGAEKKEGIWRNNKFQSARKVKPPVVAGRSSDPKKVISASSGSGFAVSSSGHVITNHHVIKGCQKVKIHHKGKSIAATVITFDPGNDLALLKGDFRPTTVFSLRTKSPELLQDVYVAGYPFGRRVSRSVKVTKGIISSLTGIGNNFANIQIDAALQPGNSGGPILDNSGNVVGVAVARLDKIKTLKNFGSLPENTNFGIKTSMVRSILESNNISLPRPNKSSISKSKLGKMISDGTYYLSCWMTTAQIAKMRSKKVIFQNLD